MWPAAAVSGYYFANPEAKLYFGLGKITRKNRWKITPSVKEFQKRWLQKWFATLNLPRVHEVNRCEMRRVKGKEERMNKIRRREAGMMVGRVVIKEDAVMMKS